MDAHGFGVGDNGAEVLDHGADMQAFLNIKVVEIFPFQSHRCVHWLF